MSLAYITLNQIIIIFIIIFIGVICYKIKFIDDNTTKRLSDILLMLVNPMAIFVSYQREFSVELLEGLMISLLLAAATHILSILISYLLVRRRKKVKVIRDGIEVIETIENKDAQVERMACIYSNVGFLGMPLVNGIFGSEGVFYVTASVTMFNIFLWTHGVIMMNDKNDFSFKSLLKKLMSPSIIAIFVGLLFFLLQIRLPDVMFQAFNYIAMINTPFAMLIAGATIGKTDILKLLTKYKVLYITFLKLLLIPVVLLLLYSLFPINRVVLITAVIMAATPGATTGILFAIKYKKNQILAAEIFAVTTLLCSVTIPLIVSLTELLIGKS